MRVHQLSKRDAKACLQAISALWPASAQPGRAREVKAVEVGEDEQILSIDGVIAVRMGDFILPFLQSTKHLDAFPAVTVDTGAVRFVCNGADVMRPGVVGVEGDFNRGDIVAVREERYKKHIAVGSALIRRLDMTHTAKGPMVRNLHYVGDRFWEAFKAVRGRI